MIACARGRVARRESDRAVCLDQPQCVDDRREGDKLSIELGKMGAVLLDFERPR